MIVKKLKYFNGNNHDTINSNHDGVMDISLHDGMALVEYEDGRLVYIISSYIRLTVKEEAYKTKQVWADERWD